jgi:hypothetical protein
MLSFPSVVNRVGYRTLEGDRNGTCWTNTSIPIRRVIRRMRGGSQAQLVEGHDGHHYVTKFLGNPQGNRCLINEVIASRLMSCLEVTLPEIGLLDLVASTQSIEEAYFQAGNRRVPPQQGLHFGSRCPVNPDKTAIFDFLPNASLCKVTNLSEFATMFVLDRWLHLADKRQAIYYRDRAIKDKVGYKACFIDHGWIFGGQAWELLDTPGHALAFPKTIYSMLDMRALTMAAVERVQAISGGELQLVLEDIPDTWFGPEDRECFAKLLVKLDQRKSGLHLLVSRHLDFLKL